MGPDGSAVVTLNETGPVAPHGSGVIERHATVGPTVSTRTVSRSTSELPAASVATNFTV